MGTLRSAHHFAMSEARLFWTRETQSDDQQSGELEAGTRTHSVMTDAT